MNRSDQSSRRGFTLVELLVVIAVIGLLCALTIPALSKARMRARKVACGGTLHGLATAVKTYLSQNVERYPAAAEMPSVNTALPALPPALQPLAPTPPSAWRCPADHTSYARASDNRTFGSYFEGEGLSYEYNMSLGGQRLEQDFLFPLLGATNILILGDFDNFHANKGDPAAKNLLFADGHVGGIDDIAKNIAAP